MTSNHVIRANVIGEISAERRRQIVDEGFDEEHDDSHVHGALLSAAVATLLGDPHPFVSPGKGYREQLVIAAALIVAEIERLDREVRDKEEEEKDD